MTRSSLIVFNLILTLFSISGCKNTSDKGSETADKVTPQGVKTLPNLPPDVYTKLLEETTSMDLIPFNTQVSMSVDDKESIESFVTRYILNTPVVNGLRCTQPDGRLFFKNIQGSSYMEADLYFNGPCKYFVYFKSDDPTPLYASEISLEGYDYFSRMYSEKPVEEFKKLQEGK